jgi:uncharacterized protein YbaR (Trm112 family)
MLVLKSCPHCHGDLALDSDRRAMFLACVQCGHILSRVEERALGMRVSRQGILHPQEGAVRLMRQARVPLHA